MAKQLPKKKRLTSFRIIILGFIGLILLGSVLLMLPISARSHTVTPFSQALFTSVSAACVTGLVVQDTATHWSVFGQAVILVLIQIGGLGVVTMMASIAMLSGKRLSLSQRSTMQNAISAPMLGGIVRLTKFVVKGTVIIELSGAVFMMPVFIKDYGAKGIWMSFFHSVSAFCNAGFDVMGTPDNKFRSMTSYASNPLINAVIMLLIIIGGISFITWTDVAKYKLKIKRYKLQTKLILLTSALLIIVPAILFFISDFKALPVGERILGSLFQSVTTRTAGFNTEDLTTMTATGQAVSIVLMLIGGSPGSTAGGMKTTTFAVLIANAVASFRRKDDPEVFGRRIGAAAVRTASTLLLMYITLCFTGAAIISAAEGLPLKLSVFEAASALGTVGLTLGITPQLGQLSQCVLMTLMFLGRVGGLTVIFAAISTSSKKLSRLPQENVTVG
jgi:trk system potassium uptake protein TrkH